MSNNSTDRLVRLGPVSIGSHGIKPDELVRGRLGRPKNPSTAQGCSSRTPQIRFFPSTLHCGMLDRGGDRSDAAWDRYTKVPR